MQEDVFRLVGSVVDGRYRIDEVVGEGAFGVVYQGWHLGFDHAVAIKCLKVPPHFTADAQRLFLESFRNEGKLLSALSGRNLGIVRVYDFGVTAGGQGAQVPYLILDWLRGRDLQAVLAERMEAGLGPYGEQEAVALLRPAVEALASAHSSTPPIAHRDVKPANLFVVEQGATTLLKVLDFGIAKAMQEGESATQLATRTRSAFTAFTPEYGAPEQFQPGAEGYGGTGPWTDVYALALVLVELLTGKPALDGTNPYTLFAASTSTTRPTPRTRGASVSDGLEAVCDRALAVKTADRYRHAGELLEALDALQGEASSAPRPQVRATDRPTRRWSRLVALALFATVAAAYFGQAALREAPSPPVTAAASSLPDIAARERPPEPAKSVEAATVGLERPESTARSEQDPAPLHQGTAPESTSEAPKAPPARRAAVRPAAKRPPVANESIDPRYDVTSAPGVVIDKDTGLTWQRTLPATYAGCRGRYRPPQGKAGDACTWLEAMQYCDDLVLSGRRDWRLPTVRELESIVDDTKARPDPTIDRAVFPNTRAEGFWIASVIAANLAFLVNFAAASSVGYGVEGAGRVRCVR